MTSSKNVVMKNAISNPIFPRDYESFDSFIDAVCEEWFICYNLTHK